MVKWFGGFPMARLGADDRVLPLLAEAILKQ